LTRRPEDQAAEWHRRNKAGETIKKIAAADGTTPGAVRGAVARYRKARALPALGHSAFSRTSRSYSQAAEAERRAARPDLAFTVVERDGVSVKVYTKPGYADGYGWLAGIEE
jgi:hypothetical protein